MKMRQHYSSTFCIFFCFLVDISIWQHSAEGQVHTITVPEGIYAYPKVISEIYIDPFILLSSCYIDSYRFAASNGLRMSYKPKRFGLEIAASNSTKRKRSLHSKPQSTSSDSKLTNVTTTPLLTTTHNSTINNQTVQSSLSATTATAVYPPTNSRTTTTDNNEHSTSSNPTTVTTTTNSTENVTYTTTPAHATTSSYGQHAQLVQLHDLDREKVDKHLVTVHCFDETNTAVTEEIILIKVSDINDNTPIFQASSLKSLVSTNASSDDAVLYLKATDADIGLNALLRFGKVRGSERVLYPNEIKPGHSSFPSVAVLPSGFVILTKTLRREVTITFKVTVKDRGDEANGNRATATATVSIYDDLPHPLPPDKTEVSWWVILCSCVGAICLIVVMAWLGLKYRQRRQLSRSLLVLTDDTLLDNDEELSHVGRNDDELNLSSRLELDREAFG